jgi:hypothetical protein
MTDNVYKKDKNGKYVPFGLRYDENYLPDGIWYVRHHEGCHSMSNVPYLEGLYKLASPEDFGDIKQLCSLQEYSDFIMDSQEFRDLIDDPKGYTISELVSLCVGLVFKKNKSKKKKK